jgi:hypothetical protein
LTHRAFIPFLKPIATAPSYSSASSSSDSSNLSIESEASREMSPEFDPKAAYEACAPLH